MTLAKAPEPCHAEITITVRSTSPDRILGPRALAEQRCKPVLVGMLLHRALVTGPCDRVTKLVVLQKTVQLPAKIVQVRKRRNFTLRNVEVFEIRSILREQKPT